MIRAILLLAIAIAAFNGLTEGRYPFVNEMLTDACVTSGKIAAKGVLAITDGFLSYNNETLHPALMP